MLHKLLYRENSSKFDIEDLKTLLKLGVDVNKEYVKIIIYIKYSIK